MSLTIEQAVDAMYGHLTTGWNNLPSPPTLLYEDRGQEIPGTDVAWARAEVRHNEGGQATLGEKGYRTFERIGFVTVQIFTPLNQGRAQSDKLAQAVIDIFEGETAGNGAIWFRRVRANEVGRDGGWFQINVLAEFEYDQQR